MKDYIITFCKELDIPQEAAEALAGAYAAIEAVPRARALFYENITAFNEGRFLDNNDELKLLDAVAELSRVDLRVVHMLFYVCLSPFTRKLYEQRGIPYKIFFDTMTDIKWKLLECKKLNGVWGSARAAWYKDFFELKRFTLGRLQFELKTFMPEHYSKNGHSLSKGDTVINMHIPSCGPLLPEACHAAYDEAAEFFKDAFAGRPVAFVCNSWLIFPRHREFLPANSNLLKFMDDFDIISYTIDEKYSNMWRIFYKPVTFPLSEYVKDVPRDTSLQRAYADWLAAGNEVGSGYGVFFH